MNVLSLFNGMSTGQTALENVGININKYYSSEIKPIAIKLTQHHYPDTIQLGDVEKWEGWDIDWKSIDLVLSGSPCQDLSIAGNRKGINAERSGLFWVFVDILNHIKKLNPKVLFLQENVGSAPIEDVGIISRALGVYPVRINSSLVTAQLRDRYYWSNIRVRKSIFDLVTDIPQPKNRKIMFKDIITSGYTDRDKARAILESEERPLVNLEKLYHRYRSTGMQTLVFMHEDEIRVRTNTKKGYDVLTENDCLNLSFPKYTTRRGRITKGKAPCLLEGNEPLYTFTGNNIRLLNKVELCRLQGFPDNWCDILTRNQAASLLGDGWTLPIIEHIFSFIKR